MTGCRRAQPLRQDLPSNERESYRIGLSLPTTQLIYRKAMKELVEAAYPGTQDDGGIEILIYDAGGSQKQAEPGYSGDDRSGRGRHCP